MPTNQQLQSTGIREVIKLSRIEEATVVENIEVNNQHIIILRCEDQNIHTSSTPIDALTKAIPINVFGHDGATPAISRIKPVVGTRCLVMFKDPQDFGRGYYLGAINEPYSRYDYPMVSSPDGSIKLLNEKGTGYDISSTSFITAAARTTYSKLTADGINIFNPSMNFIVGRTQLSIVNQTISFNSNTSGTNLTSLGKFNLGSGGDLNLSGENSTLDFKGGKLSVLADLIEATSSQRVIAAGIFKYRGVSAAAFADDPTAPTYEVSILQGDTSFLSASGNYRNGILNPAFKLLQYVGLSEDAPFSKFEMKNTEIDILVDPTSTGTITSNLNLGSSSALIEYKAAIGSSKAEFKASEILIDFSPTGSTAAKIEMKTSASRYEQNLSGLLKALLELKSSGAVKLLGKSDIDIFSDSANITVASGTLVSESMILKTLMMKMDSMLQRIELKILEATGLTISMTEVHGNPDVTAGATPLAPFPVNVSLRQHGHLTLVGPTITKLPVDLIPFV